MKIIKAILFGIALAWFVPQFISGVAAGAGLGSINGFQMMIAAPIAAVIAVLVWIGDTLGEISYELRLSNEGPKTLL